MVYEIYLDSVLLEMFVLNLCLLTLVNSMLWKTTGWGKRILGAFFGAVGGITALLLPGGSSEKCAITLVADCLMLWMTFPVRHLRNYLKTLETFLICAAMLGGSIYLIGNIPGVGMPGNMLMITGMEMLFTAVWFFQLKKGGMKARKQRGSAVLVNGEKKLCVSLLVDSGNNLREPISGKPVCVLDGTLAALLWNEGELYRVIPYCSVGKQRGIMKGYQLPRLELDMGGPVKILKNVYVAVSPQALTEASEKVELLVHPDLISEKGK